MKKYIERALAFLRRHPKATGAAALALCVALLFAVVNSPVIVGVSASRRSLPIYCVQSEEKRVALTFDAAWGNEDTETLIDILAGHGVRATFFLVGDWVDKYPESVRALSGAGMEIGSHSDHHDHYSKLSSSAIVSDVSSSCDKIEAVTGARPTLFRCPYGEYDDHVIDAIRGMGIYPIQWDVDSLDWKELSAAEITKRVLGGVSPGSIVLFHNAAKHTPEALAGIIEALQRDRYEIVTVSELLLDGEYNIDHTGRMCPAA